MSLIARYLAREFLISSLVVLAALVLVWVAADALLHVEELQAGVGAALRGVLLRSLDLFPQGVPTACGIGAVFSLSRATRALEITAIRCGGIKLRRALTPVLLLCILVAGLLGVFQDRVLIPTHLSLAGAETPERDERPQLVGDRWWYVSNSWLFSAADFDARERTLRDVTVFRLGEDHQVVRRLDAASAVYLSDGQWRFLSALDHSFGDDATLDVRRFDKLSLNLGVDLTSALMRDASGKVVPELMTLHDLSDATAEASNPTEIRVLRGAFHGRLALPLAVLVLVLLAVPEGLGGNDRDEASLPKSLLKALGLMTGFWAIWTLARLGSQSGGELWGVALLWGTMALALAFGAWRFQRINE